MNEGERRCFIRKYLELNRKDMVYPPLAGRLVLMVFSCALLTIACSPDRANISNGQPDTTAWPSHFGFGREASLAHIQTWNIDVRPDGQGLPPGSGTVGAGYLLYQAKCARCHGASGWGGPYMALVTDTSEAPPSGERADKTIGNYWPYATTLYDYIRRAMPYDSAGSLSPEEVYCLTAYLLHANHIIDTAAVLTAETLPHIIMPAQSLFIPDDRQGGPEIR